MRRDYFEICNGKNHSEVTQLSDPNIQNIGTLSYFGKIYHKIENNTMGGTVATKINKGNHNLFSAPKTKIN